MRHFLALPFVFALGCPPATTSSPTDRVTLDRKEPCNPLGYGPECLNPWPSSVYLEPAESRTGWRINVPSNAMPVSSEGLVAEPAQFGGDGFSPATSVIVHLPGEPDVATLTPHTNLDKSLTSESSTLIIDVERKERHVHFAEIDVTAAQPADRVLILRPMRRLRPQAQYLVVIRKSVKPAAGGDYARSAGMEAVLAGKETDSTWLNANAARLRGLVDVAVELGVARDDVLMAFDFRTASQESITRNLLSMRDQAVAALGPRGIGVTVESNSVGNHDNVARVVRGTYSSPLFLDSAVNGDATLNVDATGAPLMNGTWERNFSVIVPPSVLNATEPRPLLIYGHGLLGSGYGEILASPVRNLAETLGMVVVATDWTGLSEMDLGVVTGALRDFSTFHRTGSRLQQGIIDAVALTRTVSGMLSDDAALKRSDGTKLIDSSTTYFDGNSLGGIMGFTFLAITPDIERGVVGVGAGNWSFMIHRSSNWPGMALIMDDAYQNPVERQVLISMSQTQWDFADPITFAAHLPGNPLPGATVRHVLAQIGVGDGQVSNLSSDLMYGSAGLPLLTQSAVQPWGFTAGSGGDNGYCYWEFHVPNPPPLTNAAAQDTPAHEAVRRNAAALEQKRRFLRPGGQVELTCDGMCDPD